MFYNEQPDNEKAVVNENYHWHIQNVVFHGSLLFISDN